MDNDLKKWGFKGGTKSTDFFVYLPIYPKTKTRKEVCKELNLTGRELGDLLRGLPRRAPIIEDYNILSRLK